MIEAGEPLYYYIGVAFGLMIFFMLGIVWGSVSTEVKKDKKIPTDGQDQTAKN